MTFHRLLIFQTCAGYSLLCPQHLTTSPVFFLTFLLFTECNSTTMCNAKLSTKHATAEWFELMWVRDRVVSLSLSRNNMKLISYNYKSLMLPESSNIALCLSAAQSGDDFERGIWPGNVIRFALSQRGMFFCFFLMFTVSQCHICSSRYQRGEEGWLWYSLQTCSQENLAFLTDFFFFLKCLLW